MKIEDVMLLLQRALSNGAPPSDSSPIQVTISETVEVAALHREVETLTGRIAALETAVLALVKREAKPRRKRAATKGRK